MAGSLDRRAFLKLTGAGVLDLYLRVGLSSSLNSSSRVSLPKTDIFIDEDYLAALEECACCSDAFGENCPYRREGGLGKCEGFNIQGDFEKVV